MNKVITVANVKSEASGGNFVNLEFHINGGTKEYSAKVPALKDSGYFSTLPWEDVNNNGSLLKTSGVLSGLPVLITAIAVSDMSSGDEVESNLALFLSAIVHHCDGRPERISMHVEVDGVVITKEYWLIISPAAVPVEETTKETE